jgi:hypothetical protein
METSCQQQLLQLIKEEWQGLPAQWRPWSVWITLHTPLAAEVHCPLQPTTRTLRSAWFLEERMNVPQERSIWAFTRFWIMHFERPWDATGWASDDPRFAARCYPVGMAAFAPYVDSFDIYLQTVWGGRWGLGRHLITKADGRIEPLRGLWIA